jgi:nicotinamide mononucleotide transporter
VSDFWLALVEQSRALSFLELTAVLAAIAYLLLAIRQSIWCWSFAAVSTAIYIYLFIDSRLYMESLLNVFYFGMALYGWYSWSHAPGEQQQLPVASWRWTVHLVAIVLVFVCAAVTGLWLERHTDAAFPFADSITTCGAVWATFLVARKVLENWWYWLAIDGLSIYLYWARGLELTALLFVAYIVMIPFGLLSWRNSMRESASC